jgi:hypothetical protein
MSGLCITGEEPLKTLTLTIVVMAISTYYKTFDKSKKKKNSEPFPQPAIQSKLCPLGNTRYQQMMTGQQGYKWWIYLFAIYLMMLSAAQAT